MAETRARGECRGAIDGATLTGGSVRRGEPDVAHDEDYLMNGPRGPPGQQLLFKVIIININSRGPLASSTARGV